MFFSIILPVYNVKKYLEQCLASIVSQTFTDYEIILVDDGSTDGSEMLCESFKEQFKNVIVIHQKNSGQGSARNKGLSVANGNYIIFIDSDDFIIGNNFLQDIYATVQKKNSDLVMYKFCKYYDGAKELEKCTFSMAEASQLDDTEEILKSLVRNDAFYGAPWSKVIRRRMLIDNNIEFENGLVGEDMEWMCHIMTCFDSISVIDKPYIAYRQRKGSTSKINKLKNLTDFIYILEKWSVGIEKANISESRKESLRGALAKYYSNLMITYLRVSDPKKKDYKNRVKALHSLLYYSKSKRPYFVKRVYSLVGFNGTLLALKILDNMKG